MDNVSIDTWLESGYTRLATMNMETHKVFFTHREDFKKHLLYGRKMSPLTVDAYIQDVTRFHNFITSSTPDYKLENITHYDVRDFMLSLENQGLSNASISRIIAGIKNFFRFLVQKETLPSSPLALISAPKKIKKIPEFMFEQEVDFLISLPGTGSYSNYRDSLIMELCYSTGVRVSELTRINETDVAGTDTLKVLGKGNKERIVPLGARCTAFIADYLLALQIYRNTKQSEDPALFLNRFGARLTARGVRGIIRKYVLRGAMIKKISPHTFRHSIATHLINNGADIMAVKELLGHVSLSTTRIYTHISQDRIKRVYRNTHPRA